MTEAAAQKTAKVSKLDLISHDNVGDIVERFGDQGGYFDRVVRPMLQSGHEGELCSWFKEMSLIRTICTCPHPQCEGRAMVWNPARIKDKYSWTCPKCSRKVNIRDGSFFDGLKSELKFCLQAMFGWCQVTPENVTASCINLKEYIVKRIYERCGQLAETYVRRHPEEWILGGRDKVLIVDEFPGGYMTENLVDTTTSKKRNNNSHTILCIAEANAVPPRMWLHMIQAVPEPPKLDNGQIMMSKCGMVEEALNEIMRHCLPGSYILANNRARCCSYESLQELKQYKVISVEYLRKFDPPGINKLFSNLETIWQTGVEVCEDVQETAYASAQTILSTHLWRQRFGTTPSLAFENILHHIAEYYSFI